MCACACLLVSQQRGVRPVRGGAGPCISRKTSSVQMAESPSQARFRGSRRRGANAGWRSNFYLHPIYPQVCVCMSPPQLLCRSPVQPAPTPSLQTPHFQIPDPSQEPLEGFPTPSASRELRSSWRGTRRGPLVTSKERAEMLGATRAGPGSWQSQTDFQVPSSQAPKPCLPIPPSSPGPARRDASARLHRSPPGKSPVAGPETAEASGQGGAARGAAREASAPNPSTHGAGTHQQVGAAVIPLRHGASLEEPQRRSHAGDCRPASGPAPPRPYIARPPFPTAPATLAPHWSIRAPADKEQSQSLPGAWLEIEVKGEAGAPVEGAGTPGSQSERRWAGLRRSGPVGTGPANQLAS